MLKIHSLILIFIILITLTSNSIFHQQNISKEKIVPNNVQALNHSVVSREKLNPDNPKIQNYFMKVAEVPYKANYNSYVPKTPSQFWKDNSGDCDDKSVAFAEYLYQKGARDVRLVSITHKSEEYAHECVMWKDRIFDATAEPPIYNMNKTEYYNFIQKKGFKLWVDYPYEPVPNSTDIV